MRFSRVVSSVADPGSGINIPDPQHCLQLLILIQGWKKPGFKKKPWV
jgi:hypothetical protein